MPSGEPVRHVVFGWNLPDCDQHYAGQPPHRHVQVNRITYRLRDLG